MAAKRKLTLADTQTGLPESEEAELKLVAQQALDLLVSNWTKIRKTRDEDGDGKVSFGFRVKLDHSGKKPKVATKLRVSTAWSDEVDGYVQTEFPLATS